MSKAIQEDPLGRPTFRPFFQLTEGMTMIPPSTSDQPVLWHGLASASWSTPLPTVVPWPPSPTRNVAQPPFSDTIAAAAETITPSPSRPIFAAALHNPPKRSAKAGLLQDRRAALLSCRIGRPRQRPRQRKGPKIGREVAKLPVCLVVLFVLIEIYIIGASVLLLLRNCVHLSVPLDLIPRHAQGLTATCKELQLEV